MLQLKNQGRERRELICTSEVKSEMLVDKLQGVVERLSFWNSRSSKSWLKNKYSNIFLEIFSTIFDFSWIFWGEFFKGICDLSLGEFLIKTIAIIAKGECGLQIFAFLTICNHLANVRLAIFFVNLNEQLLKTQLQWRGMAAYIF